MQHESNWRYYATVGVTLLCLILIYPTVSYVYFVNTEPAPVRESFQSDEAFNEASQAYDQKKGTKQRGAIKLGLDLVGGVDVQLQIDKAKTLADLLNNRGGDLRDNISEKQIGANIGLNPAGDCLVVTLADKADARQVNNILQENVKNDNFEPYDEAKFLADGTTELRLSASVLDRHISEAMASAQKRIRDRVDEFGVTQPSVSRQDDNSIRVQIPGERDTKRVINEIIRPAQLEFYALYDENDEFVRDSFEKVKELDIHEKERDAWRLKDGIKVPAGYMVMEGKDLAEDAYKGENRKDESDSPLKKVYIVKRQPEMNGDHLRNAYMDRDPSNIQDPIIVSLGFDSQGARQFHNLSKEYLKKRVAIALDKKVYSAPVFQVVIPNGRAQISGSFTTAEAHDLALVLKAGALPAELKAVHDRQIGPTLGAESIVKSTQALLIGAVCITVFMVTYYGTAGVISIIALFLNVLVIVACLDMFDATLTLSGIGGIILTIGMAVDANVLIYERIREEVNAGRTIRDAIRSGFGAAFSVILDSNLTTLLAAFVLLQFGEGSVQGFALTMSFGLLANLFTGLTVTYALCRFWFNLRGKIGLGFLYIFRNPNYDFIAMRRITFPLSGLMVAGAIAIIVMNGGPNMAVDFRGGVLSEVRVNAEGNQSGPLNQALDPSQNGQARVQRVTDENLYLVRLALLTPPAGEDEVKFTQSQLEEKLKSIYDKPGQFEILSTTSVSKEVGQDFRDIAVMVIIAASICIMIYLWFRFELVFGVAAVIALVHDLIITLGAITLLDIQVSLDIVSALLILLGFSVNDTIVIFDRVRENSHTMFGKSFKDICNYAMNRSLSRTLITSATTVGVMVIMYIFGGHSLAPFALTLIIGGIVGTYSSDFIAAPLVFWWNERQRGKIVEHLSRGGDVPQTADGKPALASATIQPIGAAPAKTAAAPQPERRRGRR